MSQGREAESAQVHEDTELEPSIKPETALPLNFLFHDVMYMLFVQVALR